MDLADIKNNLTASQEIRTNVVDLLDDMPGGFFVYEAAGDEKLIYANDACLRIFGCKTLDQFKELTGFTFPGMVHKDDLEEVEQSIAHQIENDVHNMDYVEYRIVTYDGSVRWIEDYGHYVQLESGDYFYVFINDATEKLISRMNELEQINTQLNEAYSREKEHKRLLYDALQQANTANIAKTTFLNNMSHDIRTLLNAVTGYSNLITDHLDDSDRIEQYAKKINDASDQLLDVVAETLEVSRFESGRTQLVENECSLTKMISEVKDRFNSKAIKKGVAFDVDFSNVAHGDILTDEQRVKHIMEQLVDNAIKYTPVGGEINLCVEEKESTIEGFGTYKIVVSDTGEGMSQSFVDHMFDPFARERTTTDSGISGTGLGLTIVKHSVDLLSGTLDVETSVNNGTKITVVFSAKIINLSEKSEIVLPASLEFENLKVLLVEDNPINREIAVCLLEDNNAQVQTAEDGKQALSIVANSNPGDIDIVLMDIQLPVMDGYSATKAIRALENPLLANIPIIAVTSDAFPEDRKRVLSTGMNAHVAKPLTIENLKLALGSLI